MGAEQLGNPGISSTSSSPLLIDYKT